MCARERPPHTDTERGFDRQVRNVLSKGYPSVMGVTETAFLQHIEPLKARLKQLTMVAYDVQEGRIPFVLVITHALIAPEATMPLVERAGKAGCISMHPVALHSFKPIDGVDIPHGTAYLLGDIDRGSATLNITPDEALPMIAQDHRSPLTIDEGIAVLTHYPAFLQKNHCFSLLASRCGDRRVPALWLSAGRPKLGWCWAGNPHTWLGSASCKTRLGP